MHRSCFVTLQTQLPVTPRRQVSLALSVFVREPPVIPILATASQMVTACLTCSFTMKCSRISSESIIVTDLCVGLPRPLTYHYPLASLLQPGQNHPSTSAYITIKRHGPTFSSSHTPSYSLYLPSHISTVTTAGSSSGLISAYCGARDSRLGYNMSSVKTYNILHRSAFRCPSRIILQGYYNTVYCFTPSLRPSPASIPATVER